VGGADVAGSGGSGGVDRGGGGGGGADVSGSGGSGAETESGVARLPSGALLLESVLLSLPLSRDPQIDQAAEVQPRNRPGPRNIHPKIDRAHKIPK